MNSRSMNRIRMAILAGAGVTVAVTVLLFVLPVVIPLNAVKRVIFAYTNQWWAGNPFNQLRVFGGVPGGLLAGYLSKDYAGRNTLGAGLKAGVAAPLLGLAAVYLLYVVYNLVHAVVVSGMFPPPVYVIVFVPLVFVLPLFYAYLVEGVVAGAIGTGLSAVRDG